MRRLIEEGDGLALVSDQIARPPTLREEVQVAVARIQELHSAWDQDTIVLRYAVILLEFASSIGVDWKSAMLRVKIMTAILLDELRAHAAGAYHKEQGVWTRCSELSNDLIERLEESTRASMALVMKRKRWLPERRRRREVLGVPLCSDC